MNPRIKISHNNIFCMLLLYHIFQTISSRIKNPKAPVKITSAFNLFIVVLKQFLRFIA